jgi:tartrate/fumarate subfamily iron-sulfur-dependent hydro-lyase beta chain
MIDLATPLKKEDLMELKAGDTVTLSGTIFTARDRAHRYFLENDFKKIKGGVIYHCGPIMMNREAISAGPTTSARMDPYTPRLIERYGIRAVIGKGGMSKEVIEAMRGKAVYLSAIGGAGVLYADAMRFADVSMEKEFGMPEAIWEFDVEKIPLVVGIDAHGRSLYEEISLESGKGYASLLGLDGRSKEKKDQD